MTLSARSIRRAGAATLAALTFVACSDSSTAPLDISPEELESIGLSMAIQLESGVLQLSAQDAMGTIDAPALSVQRCARSTRLRKPQRFGSRLTESSAPRAVSESHSI